MLHTGRCFAALQVDKKNSKDETALMNAVESCQPQTAKALLDAGAAVNEPRQPREGDSMDTWLCSGVVHASLLPQYCSRTANIPVVPHEAVPEVSKGKVHITQNKHVPIEWFVTTASQSRI